MCTREKSFRRAGKDISRFWADYLRKADGGAVDGCTADAGRFVFVYFLFSFSLRSTRTGSVGLAILPFVSYFGVFGGCQEVSLPAFSGLREAFCIRFFLFSEMEKETYLDFLRNYDDTDPVIRNRFWPLAWEYWLPRIVDEGEEKAAEREELRLHYRVLEQRRRRSDIRLNRFDAEIEAFLRQDAAGETVSLRPALRGKTLLAVGSSSIRLWQLPESFGLRGIRLLNRGFGGATWAELDYYYPAVIGKHQAEKVILYTDTDLERGCDWQYACEGYAYLSSRILSENGSVRLYLPLSKFTPIDFLLGREVRKNKAEFNRWLSHWAANRNRVETVDTAGASLESRCLPDRRFFMSDLMHLNQAGYAVWNESVRRMFLS